jgi:hypothetical protein
MEPNHLKKREAAPASSGFAWLLQSLTLLRLQAPRLLLIAVLMQLILSLTQIPLLGILVVVAVPALSAGILEAFHVSGQGRLPAISLLFKPLMSAPRSGRLMGLGALVFLVAVLSISVLMPAGPEAPDPELLSRIQQGDMEAMAQLDPYYLKRMAVALMIGIAISGTMSYFTIPLIWFRGLKLMPALTMGLRALIRNWKAFMVLALGLALASIPVAIVVGILFTISGSGGLVSALVMGMIMLLLLFYQMMLFGSQYCAFRDLFDLGDSPHPDQADGGQLVA